MIAGRSSSNPPSDEGGAIPREQILDAMSDGVRGLLALHKAIEANGELMRLVVEQSQSNPSLQGLISRLTTVSQNLDVSASALHRVVTTFIETNCSSLSRPPPASKPGE